NDPQRATAVANSLAGVILRLSPSGGESYAAVLNDQMREQATEIEQSTNDIDANIEELKADLDNAATSEEQRSILEQLSQERNRLAEGRSALTLLYSTLLDTFTNQVKIIEPAVTGNPVSRRLPILAFMAGMAGLIVALSVALVYEYLNNTVDTVEDLKTASDAPVLGTISSFRVAQHNHPDESLFVLDHPRSPAAEDFRRLGTKLSVSGDSPAIRSVLVSSIQESESAGEIAANLAIVLSQTGKRVILVDADLHHPTVDKLFGISGRFGLINALDDQSIPPELTAIEAAPGLSVLPSGPPPQDSFSRLASPRVDNLLHELDSQADVIVVAASPLPTFADSLLIASRVDGVVLVVRSGSIQEESVNDAVSSLKTVGAHLLGTVLVTEDSHGWFQVGGRNIDLTRSRVRFTNALADRYRTRRLPAFFQRSAKQNPIAKVRATADESAGQTDEAGPITP
ncbi:MAG: hypothetical protein WA996_06645, partial [Candidatus Promineifilaceae bacterium]